MGKNNIKTMSLDEFKKNVSNDTGFTASLIGRHDIVDIKKGKMVIYIEHLNKYLEKYACKDADDLQDTLYNSYGVFVKIVE